MNRFYKIIEGDCLKILPTLEKESVDFILTDPPFNVGLKYNKIDDNLSNEDYENWCYGWIKEFSRVLKIGRFGIISTCDINVGWLFNAISRTSLIFHHFLKWNKRNSNKRYKGTRLYQHTELSFIFSNEQPNYNFPILKKMAIDTITFPTLPSNIPDVDGFIGTHKARRPIGLYEKIIEAFTLKDEVVLDCFLGTGTTLLACKNLERRCIGIEIDSEYVQMAKKRLDEHKQFYPDRKLSDY